jgi:imidazolonepropionase-like amidohydrolase
MVRNGMSPAQAIRSATVDASELLGVSARVGTIQQGKEADLIAVAGDPTSDVRLLENVGFVMKRGKVVKLDGKPQLTAAD